MPIIHLENCTQCLKCVKDCPSNAIDIKTGLISTNCIHCGHCVAICPESTIHPDKGEITALKSHTINSGDFENFTAGVRSIRYFLKKDVEKEILEKLVTNMRHYSSASNARPLEITIINSPDKIQLLNDLTANTLIKTFKLITSAVLRPVLAVFVPSLNVKGLSRYKDSFIQKHESNSSMVCHHAPVVMLFHGKVSKYDMSEADAWIWASNTILYAKTLGLGSCHIGFIVKAMAMNKKIKLEMNIPASHKVYTAIVLGYSKVNYKNETSRERPTVNYI